MSIEGSVSELSDIKAYKDGDSYFITSTTPIEELMVRVMKMDFENGDDMQMVNSRKASNKYEIVFAEDGSLSVNAVE